MRCGKTYATRAPPRLWRYRPGRGAGTPISELVAAVVPDGPGLRSLDDALAAMSEVARRSQGMRSVFLSRIDSERNSLTLVAVASDPGGCELPAGAETPLGDTY